MLLRLYQKPASCLAIFRYFGLIRLLPSLAKHVVLTMLYSVEPVAIVDFDAWFDANVGSKQWCCRDESSN